MNFPSRFFSATREKQTTETTLHAPYIRRSFDIDKSVSDAQILISGLGFYELYINGTNITKGHMAPYVSNPDDLVYFDLYSIKSCLISGRNTIGIILGNGFQNSWGGFVWDLDKGKFTSAPKFAFKVEVTYDDSSALVFEADEKCKCHKSPIYEDDLHYGESYDANLEIRDWAMPCFCDEDWDNVILADRPRGEFRVCEAEPILATRELKAQRIWREGDAYIYDFGENSAGVTRLKIKGEKNQKITILHGEMLEDGVFSQRNILFLQNAHKFPDKDLSYTQRVVYTCRGNDGEIYQPKFTYFGFQYAKVEGITQEQATPDLLTYIVMNSNLEVRGNFECSDETLNKLQEMTRRSTLSNFYYFPVDCPHREKNGWTADAALSAEHTLLNLSPEKSYREWMRNIGKAMNEEGSIPGIVPTAGWGFEWGNGPAWDIVLFELPYRTYLYRGDKEILKENSQYFFRYIKYLLSKRDEKGLVAFGLGDWCPTYAQNGYFSTYKSPLVFTDSVMAYVMCKNSAYMFGEIGMEKEKIFAEVSAERFLLSIRKHLIDFDNMIAAGDTQTSQALAIYRRGIKKSDKATRKKRRGCRCVYGFGRPWREGDISRINRLRLR